MRVKPQQTLLAESDDGDQQCNKDKLDGQDGKDRAGDKQCDDEPPSKKQRKVSGDQRWGAVGLGLDFAYSLLLKRANPVFSTP